VINKQYTIAQKPKEQPIFKAFGKAPSFSPFFHICFKKLMLLF